MKGTAIILALAVFAGCTAPLCGRQVCPPGNPASWDGFWHDKGVSPAPPFDFLDRSRAKTPVILNRTEGALDDDTVRRWLCGERRRGEGSAWAQQHLRLDLVNAGVLGPVGLNGLDQAIDRERAGGAVEMRCPPNEVVTAAVVSVSRELQQQNPELKLGDFVIVQIAKASDLGCERIFRDGHREQIKPVRAAGTLLREVDTGHFRSDAAVGPIWYQEQGWSCWPGDTSVVGQLCGRADVSE